MLVPPLDNTSSDGIDSEIICQETSRIFPCKDKRSHTETTAWNLIGFESDLEQEPFWQSTGETYPYYIEQKQSLHVLAKILRIYHYFGLWGRTNLILPNMGIQVDRIYPEPVLDELTSSAIYSTQRFNPSVLTFLSIVAGISDMINPFQFVAISYTEKIISKCNRPAIDYLLSNRQHLEYLKIAVQTCERILYEKNIIYDFEVEMIQDPEVSDPDLHLVYYVYDISNEEMLDLWDTLSDLTFEKLNDLEIIREDGKSGLEQFSEVFAIIVEIGRNYDGARVQAE